MPANWDAAGERSPAVTVKAAGELAMSRESDDRTKKFVELVVCHQHDLQRFLRALGARGDDLDEILQQTMTGLWEKWEEFDTARPFLPWAFKFAHLEVLKFRQQRRADRHVFSDAAVSAIAEHAQQNIDLYSVKLDSLRSCVERLSSRDYDLLVSKYELGMKAQDLARRTDSTVKAVYRRMDRIRQRLMKCVRLQMIEAEA